jgi:hypothetical protein
VGGSLMIQMNHLQIGRDYTIQKTFDFKAWSDVQTFTASAGTNQWAKLPDVGGAQFYRLKWQP